MRFGFSALRGAVAALLGLCFAGCASVSVTRDEFSRRPPLQTPSKIYVKPFAFEGAVLRVDREAEVLAAFQQDFSNRFAAGLQERLSQSVAPSEVFTGSRPPTSKGAWLLEGNFVRLNQGSRALRTLFGFGLGGTKIETEVRIFKLPITSKSRPVGLISTSGGTNAEPGGLVSPPLTAPLRLLAQSGQGLNRDAARTARMITAAIQEELLRNGQSVSGEKVLRAKRPKPAAE